MANQDNAAEKRKFSWNPFVKIQDDEHAKEMARDGGATCAGLIGLSYVLTAAILAFAGVSLYGPADGYTQAGNVLGIALAAFLGWRIWVRQPLWAIWFVFAWIIVETVSKLVMMGSTGAPTSPYSFFVNGVALIGGIQAVRGGMRLSAARRRARAAAKRAGFEV